LAWNLTGCGKIITIVAEETCWIHISFLRGGGHVFFHGPKDPVYTISVAARLLGVGPQFLRQIENEGLISPARTDSNIRLYSDEDLRLLSRIVYLCRVILAMEDGEVNGSTEDTRDPSRSQT
jgi:hypothetical protein